MRLLRKVTEFHGERITITEEWHESGEVEWPAMDPLTDIVTLADGMVTAAHLAEPEPWTFGDLEVGDLFMFGERGPYVVTRDYSWMNCVDLDGKTARFDGDDPVEPFTLEWVS